MSEVAQDGFSKLRVPERRGVEDLLRALLECEYHRVDASMRKLCEVGSLSREDAERFLPVAAAAGLVEKREAKRVGPGEPNGDGGLSGVFVLTVEGRRIAVRVMRAHRLTEVALARESGLRAEEWHSHAHVAEHELSDAEVNRLADALGNPRFDPHGDPIPTREGVWAEQEGVCLLEWPAGRCGVIAHIEDEPKTVFAGVAARGIFAGMRVVPRGGAEVENEKLKIGNGDAGAAACRVVVEGREFVLSAAEAGLVRVRELLVDEVAVPEGAMRLDDLGRGEEAVVLGLLSGCMGGERSRLLDLGFVPGSRILHELDSPLRGPSAFRVRGSLVALRKGQAAMVLVAPRGGATIKNYELGVKNWGADAPECGAADAARMRGGERG